MKRLALAGTALAAVAAWPQAAGASGDYGCTPSWTLATSSYECAGSAVIGPRNDTRVNLAFLLRSSAGLSSPGKLAYPEHDWGNGDFGHVFLGWDDLQEAFWPSTQAPATEAAQDYAGSRCQTLASGGADFRAALAASKGIKADERDTLAAARDLVKPACDGDKGPAAWPAVASPGARDYLAYLQGARAFYADDFASAGKLFTDLSRSKEPWLAETARYMVARNALAAAQAGAFDEWGGYEGGDKVDRPSASRARAALGDYLSAYPKGRYAASASGLTRRAAWLLGEGLVLARSYSGLMATQSPLAPEAPALLEEADSKVLFGTGLGAGSDVDAPLLLAAWDLLRMRRYDGDRQPVFTDRQPAPLTAAELGAQKGAFAKAPGLYAFLQASFAYHVAKDDRRVLALVPDDARAKSRTPLAFSAQMLRGLALDRLGDRNAPGFYQQLIGGARDLYQRPAAELALAMNWERAGELPMVFVPSSPITEPEIRTRLLAYVAGPDLLRKQARAANPAERDVAVFTLLTKGLSHGRYAEVGRDLALVPADASAIGWASDGWSGAWVGAGADARAPAGLFTRGKTQEEYPCPALARTVAALAAAPADVKGRLCLAEFWRLNAFDDYLADRAGPGPEELGGTRDLFPGTSTPRAGLYAAVLADRSASPDDTAYALYRSVMCYAPSRNNACGGKDASEAQRRAWFQRLKRDYPKSRWASELKYYW